MWKAETDIMFKDYKLKNFNFKVLLYVLVLCGISYFAIQSAVTGTANEGLDRKQLYGIAFGLSVVAVMTFVDYHLYMKFFWVFHLINMGLLVATKFFGISRNNAKRWLKLGIQIQPSELSKILLIIVMAALLTKFSDKINKWWTILISVTVSGMAWALIADQPDLSTTIVCVFVFCCMYYLAGLNYKWVGSILAVGGVGAAYLFWAVMTGNMSEKILKTYQQNRIRSFIDKTFDKDLWRQQENSIMAIGSGGLFGKGLNNDSYMSVKNGNFLSEDQTDFIFTIVGEEMGFIGTCAVILLLALLVFECFRVAGKAKDLSGKLLAGGVGSLIAVQSCVNIAVVTGSICNTGLPLPFVSYGLSSLLSLFIGIGLVMNVSMQRPDRDAKQQEFISKQQEQQQKQQQRAQSGAADNGGK